MGGTAATTPVRGTGWAPHAATALERIAAAPQAPLLLAVVGPGGSGKSVLLDEVGRTWERAGAEVVRARGAVPTGLPPAAVLLLDDAHRLDAAGTDALEALVAAAPVRLALAHRPWPRPARLGAVVASVPARLTVVVGHLDRSAVAERVTARAGAVPPDGVVDVVHEQSGGLPALVGLVTQALIDTGRYDPRRPGAFRRPDRVDVSATLAERLRHLVDGLEPRVAALLEVMAVGATLDVDVLQALLGEDVAGLADTVESARATGLITDVGALVPIVRSLVLRITPVLRGRDLQRRLAGLELERGGSVLAAGRRLLGTGASGARVATVLDAAAAEAQRESPSLAADLLAAAVDAGRPAAAVAARRAHAVALAGDLDLALRLADQVIHDPAAPDRELAVAAAAAVLAQRGLLDRSAELYLGLAPDAALLAVPALVGTGALDDARKVLEAAGGPAAPASGTLLSGAAVLMARGMLATVQGPPAVGLSELARATALLEPVAATALLPDTPGALTALVAMHCGDLAVAEATLHRCAAVQAGGRAARARLRLLHAWVALLRGRLDAVARTLGRLAGERLEPRDELLAAALDVGLARRRGDTGALAGTWERARRALVAHPVDLFTLPALGECAVAAARLGEREWLAAHVEEGDALLDRLGRPALWCAPRHWYGVLASVATATATATATGAAGARADAERHVAALGTTASGPFAAALHAAGRCWLRVLAGDVELDAVQEAAQRLHGTGLAWDAAHLAGQAAVRATDRRLAPALQAFARSLYPSDPPAAAGPADRSGDERVGPAPAGAHGPAAGPAPASGSGEGAVVLPTPRAPLEARGDGGVLNERERDIGRLVLAGLTYRQIGERLFLSAKTVEHHVARMRRRLGVTSRDELFGRLRALDGHPDPQS